MPEIVQNRAIERNPLARIEAILDADLPSHLKLTLVAMVTFGPRIFASQRRIAAKVGVSTRAVHNSINGLKARGILVPIGRVARRGPGRPTVEYRLVLAALPQHLEATEDAVSELLDPGTTNSGSPLPQFTTTKRKPTSVNQTEVTAAELTEAHFHSKRKSTSDDLRRELGSNRQTDRHARVNADRKPKTRKPKPGQDGKLPKVTPEQIVTSYHDRYQRRPVSGIDTKRRRQLTAAARAWPEVATWDAFFAKAAESDFLTGRKPSRISGRGGVDLDFLLENRVRIAEGKYDDHDTTTTSRAPAQNLEPAADAHTAAFQAAISESVEIKTRDFRLWIEPLVVERISGGRVILSPPMSGPALRGLTPEEFAGYVLRNFGPAIDRVCRKAFNLSCEVWAPVAHSIAS